MSDLFHLIVKVGSHEIDLSLEKGEDLQVRDLVSISQKKNTFSRFSISGFQDFQGEFLFSDQYLGDALSSGDTVYSLHGIKLIQTESPTPTPKSTPRTRTLKRTRTTPTALNLSANTQILPKTPGTPQTPRAITTTIQQQQQLLYELISTSESYSDSDLDIFEYQTDRNLLLDEFLFNSEIASQSGDDFLNFLDDLGDLDSDFFNFIETNESSDFQNARKKKTKNINKKKIPNSHSQNDLKSLGAQSNYESNHFSFSFCSENENQSESESENTKEKDNNRINAHKQHKKKQKELGRKLGRNLGSGFGLARKFTKNINLFHQSGNEKSNQKVNEKLNQKKRHSSKFLNFNNFLNILPKDKAKSKKRKKRSSMKIELKNNSKLRIEFNVTVKAPKAKQKQDNCILWVSIIGDDLGLILHQGIEKKKTINKTILLQNKKTKDNFKIKFNREEFIISFKNKQNYQEFRNLILTKSIKTPSPKARIKRKNKNNNNNNNNNKYNHRHHQRHYNQNQKKKIDKKNFEINILNSNSKIRKRSINIQIINEKIQLSNNGKIYHAAPLEKAIFVSNNKPLALKFEKKTIYFEFINTNDLEKMNKCFLFRNSKNINNKKKNHNYHNINHKDKNNKNNKKKNNKNNKKNHKNNENNNKKIKKNSNNSSNKSNKSSNKSNKVKLTKDNINFTINLLNKESKIVKKEINLSLRRGIISLKDERGNPISSTTPNVMYFNHVKNEKQGELFFIRKNKTYYVEFQHRNLRKNFQLFYRNQMKSYNQKQFFYIYQLNTKNRIISPGIIVVDGSNIMMTFPKKILRTKLEKIKNYENKKRSRITDLIINKNRMRIYFEKSNYRSNFSKLVNDKITQGQKYNPLKGITKVPINLVDKGGEHLCGGMLAIEKNNMTIERDKQGPINVKINQTFLQLTPILPKFVVMFLKKNKSKLYFELENENDLTILKKIFTVLNDNAVPNHIAKVVSSSSEQLPPDSIIWCSALDDNTLKITPLEKSTIQISFEMRQHSRCTFKKDEKNIVQLAISKRKFINLDFGSNNTSQLFYQRINRTIKLISSNSKK
ncbi:protein stum [Anaeramoeba flamelloides]|uniref:Protein stum n=1 Tax=Anaeramoeba flamelloides TaxID=1746091 RepID=A0ABQ8YMB9_9EUKA|nr:protein stum [Anaeramoeba flamelloides]